MRSVCRGDIGASVMTCLMAQGTAAGRARRVFWPLVGALLLFRGGKNRKGGKQPRVFPTISGLPPRVHGCIDRVSQEPGWPDQSGGLKPGDGPTALGWLSCTDQCHMKGISGREWQGKVWVRA